MALGILFYLGGWVQEVVLRRSFHCYLWAILGCQQCMTEPCAWEGLHVHSA